MAAKKTTDVIKEQATAPIIAEERVVVVGIAAPLKVGKEYDVNRYVATNLLKNKTARLK